MTATIVITQSWLITAILVAVLVVLVLRIARR